jgi:GTP-binding protein
VSTDQSAFPHAQLLLSAAQAAQFPADQGAEVAIAGRSNAGKSSAINAITGRRALARTSKQPGRTRLLNFFELAPGLRLVDLPGYGFAVGARLERDQWAALIDALATRRSLVGLLLVVDARRGLLEGDEQLLQWAALHARPVHVLLSKADQLRHAQSLQCLARARAALDERATVQLFSAHERIGVEEARERLAGWFGLERVKKKPR